MKVLSEKKVITRKKHKCFACEGVFEKNTIMIKTNMVYDNDCYSIYTCMCCNRLIIKYKSVFYDDNEDLYPEGCVRDYLKEGESPEVLLKRLGDMV